LAKLLQHSSKVRERKVKRWNERGGCLGAGTGQSAMGRHLIRLSGVLHSGQMCVVE